MYTTLISVAQLHTLMASDSPHMVFDCSFELMQPETGDAQYQQAHIPGAVRANLDRHLSAAKGATDAASGGRHPLPSRESFAAWLGSVGFRPDMQAVVYDRQGANYCGRLWWMLKWVGHEAVAVLDGGLQAWQASGSAVESGAAPAIHAPQAHQEIEAIEAIEASNYPLAPEKTALIATEDVAKNLAHPIQTLLDARAAPRFRGEMEPLDPVAGHIPGALNRPFGLNLDANGFFKKPEILRAEFDSLLAGRDPATVVHHCGSGVSALPNLIAMEVAGLGRTCLYAGSWSDWCSDPNRPCAQS